VEGAAPVIKLIRPYVDLAEVIDDFRAIFDSGTLTRGPYVTRLIEALQAYTGARFVFPTSSATTALYAALRAIGIGPGDDVLVADFSFPASGNVVEDCGARPIFVDVDPHTWNLDVRLLDQARTPRTKAVMFVDVLGNPSGLKAARVWARDQGLPLVEDAACAIGSTVDGARVGDLADVTCFSFHPRKLLTCGEGGAITTSNEKLAQTLAVKLMHGGVATGGRFSFVDYGYNFRLPDLQCAMLLPQLRHLDEIVRRRRTFGDHVAAGLAPLGFAAQRVDDGVVHNVQSLTFRVPDGFDRDRLIEALRERGMESTIGTYSMSSSLYYLNKYGRPPCPTAERLQAETLTLPCHDHVSAEEVVEKVRSVL
jgi:perosamine synthetase